MSKLKILHLEDDPLDYELAIATLEKAGYECDAERVETRADFLARLTEGQHDIILADYSLPSFDGLTALRLFKEREFDIPFILVSGSLGEEIAVQTLKSGADNYVLKDHLIRLAPAVEDALEKHRLRAAERQHIANLTLINELNQAANRGASLKELIDILDRQAKEQFEAIGAAVYLLSEDKKYLELQNQFLPNQVFAQIEKLTGTSEAKLRLPATGGTLYQKMITDGSLAIREPEIIRQYLHDAIDTAPLADKLKSPIHALVPQIQRLMKIKSFIATPLINQGQSLGMLSLSFERDFTPADVERLKIIDGRVSAILRSMWDNQALQASEERYRTIFETSPIALWEEDFSGVVAAIEELKSQGEKNVREYLDTHPEFVERAAQTITIADVNAATLETLGAESKAHLLGALERVFVPETMEILKDEMLAIAEGKTHFKGETINQTLDGQRRDMLITITFPKDHEEFDSVIVASADITEQKRAEARIQRHMSELSVLHAVAEATIQSSTEEELIDRATQVIGEALFPDHFGVLLVDEETESLFINPSYRGITEKQKQTTFPIGKKGIVGHVAATGQAYRVGDTSQDEYYFTSYTGVESELCVPLKIGGRVIGVVNAESAQLNAFSQNDERLLTTLAGQLSTGIERLRQERAEREQHILAEALRDTASALNSSLEIDEILDRILENVGRVVPFDSASILLVEGNTARVARHVGYTERGLEAWIESLEFKLDETPTLQYLTEKHQPLLIPDVNSNDLWISIPELDWIGSYLTAPISKGDVILGIINLDHTAPGFFQQAHAERLQAFADQAAIGLDNARLFTRTQQQLKYLEALRKIDVAISSSVDFDMVVEVIAEQSQALLGVDAVTVLTYDPHLMSLYCVNRKGFRTNALKHTSLQMGHGLAGRAAFEHEPLHIPDLRKEEEIIFRDAPLLVKEEFISYWGVPLIAKGEINGVLEIFHRSPLSPDQEWINFLDTLAGQAAIAIENAQLFTGLEKANQNLALAYDNTLEGWARALEIRDMETEGHSRRVTGLTVELARALNISGEAALHIRRGALLHDIGKMGIPDSILQKPGPLTEEEWEIMRQHPVYAYDMLKRIDYLRPALDIPYSHHERWDGTGYPRGLAGDSIPLPARIFTVVDVYDALISHRPYRDAWPEEKALAHIREQAGKHFDPRVVEAFMELVQ